MIGITLSVPPSQVLLLGILVAARHQKGSIGDPLYSPDEHPGKEQYIAITCLFLVAIVSIGCTYHDLRLFLHERWANGLRRRLGVRLPEQVFRLHTKADEAPSLELLKWLEHVAQSDLQRKRHTVIECIPIPRAEAAQ